MVCVHIELADWQAAHSINLGTLTTQDRVDASRDAKNFIRFGQVQDIGSQISAADSLGLTAGQDITATAACAPARAAATPAAARTAPEAAA